MTDNILYDANIGLEKESLRITKDGVIAKTRHPFQNNPQIKMDFAENQIEIATPTCKSAGELYDTLYTLHKQVVNKIKENDELLWALSSPALFLSEDNIPIAVFTDDLEETTFRNYLAERYGRKVMLYSGIHFNFSYGDRLIKSMANGRDLREFKDELYLKTAKNSFKYAWFLIYLTAASPTYDDSFLEGGFCGYSSMRNSPYGYRNKENLYLDLSSAGNYVKNIKSHVVEGRLKHVSELYSPVRIKAKKGHSTKAILNDGIEFIEIRVFDLNPFSPCGFSADDISFLHLFMIYLLSLDDFDFNNRAQDDAYANCLNGAKYDHDNTTITFDNKTRPLKHAAEVFAEQMLLYFAGKNDETATKTLTRVFDRIFHTEKRYAKRLLVTDSDFIPQGIQLTKQQETLKYEYE